MADILIHIDDAALQRFEQRAAIQGLSVEALLRQAIMAAASDPLDSLQPGSVTDEPIVKAAEIETEYRRLGYTMGWRFLMCPQDRLSTAKLLIATLNPVGDKPERTAWSRKEGNAYYSEQWDGYPEGQAPLQQQIQKLVALLGYAESEMASATFVPFRSPTWADLRERDAALQLGRSLWTRLLARAKPELIVCVGKGVVGEEIARLTDATLVGEVDIGWKDHSATRYRTASGMRIVALPHLSRFRLFARGYDDKLQMALAA